MTEPDLFSLGYPHSPAYRVGSDTSFAAAESVDANTLRAKVLEALAMGPATADECAARLGISILSARPRLTELKRMGRIIDTGTRRPNASGRSAAVFRLAA